MTPIMDFDQVVQEFDDENRLCEDLLKELFDQRPTNEKLEDVYLKVLTLNTLYSTQIRLFSEAYPTMEDVARNIVQNHQALGSAISLGKSHAVELISTVHKGTMEMDYFVFATKYCSWSSQEKFPIYDSRVDMYLRYLWKTDGFSEAVKLRGNGCSYEVFRTIIDDFRIRYGLGKKSYKQIDKYLYMKGSALFKAKELAKALKGRDLRG